MIANPIGALAVLLLLTVLMVSFLAFAALCQALLPEIITNGSLNLATRPLRSALVGLINVLFFGLLALALMVTGRPIIRLLGVLIGTLVLGVVAVGIVVVGRVVGERLRPTDERIRQQFLGTATLSLAMLLPVVGWYLLTILASLTGSGAVILALLWRQESPSSRVEDEELSADFQQRDDAPFPG